MNTEPVPVEVFVNNRGVWAVVKNSTNSYDVRPVTLGAPLDEDFRFKYQAIRWIVSQEAPNGRLD